MMMRYSSLPKERAPLAAIAQEWSSEGLFWPLAELEKTLATDPSVGIYYYPLPNLGEGTSDAESILWSACLVSREAADAAELLFIYVAPALRRQGLARQLLDFWCASINDRTPRRKIILEVRASNGPARSLYQGVGFAPIDRRRQYYKDGEDALIYALNASERGLT